ncbi:MAG TPA: hypothetical protein DIC18_01980 [Clostridiales bacterium]|nr:hypothetical protein [Clostridiales bacterium]
MPQVSDVTIIDIGSQSISAYNAERLSDDTFAVKNTCVIEYSGYMEGKWLKPEEVIPSVFKLLDRIERGSGKIKTLYVGIPADFCVVRTVYDKIVFPKPKRLTHLDIEELLNANDPFHSSQYTKISADAVYYYNDKGERMHDPVGTVTSYLKAQLSYIGAESEVLSYLRQGIMRHGIKNVRFIQSEYASAMSLFSKEERDAGVILADVGYLCTSVLYIGGDALLDLKSFSLGGAMIPMGLSDAFDIPFPVAQALTSKVNLGYKDGEYTIKYETEDYVFPVESVNNLVKECIQCIMGYIQKAIKSFRFETAPYATLFLTGGGFSEIRCARECVARCAGRSVDFVQPSVPNFEKPYYSTTVGLIQGGLHIEKQEKFGFIKRLFRV